MAQSTEDYLDSLLRQAMGIPEPEPEIEENTVLESDFSSLEDENVSEDALESNAVADMASDVNTDNSELTDGVEYTSNKVNQFFENDEPFSENFVFPEIIEDTESSINENNDSDATVETEPIASVEFEPDAFIETVAETVQEDEEDQISEPEQETTVEQNVEEVPMSMSIDDLDPANANQALSPDMIAALFAGANGDAAESVAETVQEDEQDQISEPEQETTAEQNVEEVPMSMSIDDLDPANANQALSPDMIAALFAGANGDADETGLEENTVLDTESFGEVESLPEELVEDEEISNLLNSIGELDNTQNSLAGTDMEVGGLDLGDVDLGAMLESVNSSMESDINSDDNFNSDDFSADDLNSLLNSLDADEDISDIGDMLTKDEKSEIISSDSEIQSLFAADSDEAFNLDSLLDDTESGESDKKKKKEKKKKDKKKKGLFGKKNTQDEQIITIDSDEEVAIDPGMFDLPEEKTTVKQKGFFGKFLDKLFEEVEEEEVVKGKLIEETPVDIAIEGAEVNEQILQEVSEEESDDKKKKKDKKKKSDKDSDSDEEESSKKKKKKEKKEKTDPEPEEPMKKLPLKKVIVIFLLCISIGAFIVLFSLYYPYFADMHNAKKYYSAGDYESTYKYLSGHELNEEEQLLFEKTVIILKPDRMYNSYLNYMKMGYKIEALNALVQGVQVVDEYGQRAEELGVSDRFYSSGNKIVDSLNTVFKVDVNTAREWYQLEDTPEYTRALYDYLYNLQPRDEDGNLIYYPPVNSVEIMTNEENNT